VTTPARLGIVALLTLTASLAPDIVLIETQRALPAGYLLAKAGLLALVVPLLAARGERALARYAGLLALIVWTQPLMLALGRSPAWASWLATLGAREGSFAWTFGGSVALKGLAALTVLGALWLSSGSWRAAYALPGELRVRASRIGWLGIPGDTLSWGRLSLYAGFAIAVGTLLLTLLTVTGFALPENAGRLVPLLPLIALLAAVNAWAEGVAYRQAVLAPLAGVLPAGAIALTSATFFGVAHYYGAPSGVIGVLMSGLLGWFLARATLETRGALAAWFIHFLQDVVIFSTIVLLLF
jgi:hypothetical protein